MIHKYRIQDAIEYGLKGAVILSMLRQVILTEGEQKEGKLWTHMKAVEVSDELPYLSQWQVYRELKKLVKAGILVTGNFNDHKYNRTRWYTIDEDEFIK